MNIVTRLSSNATQYDFISYRQHSSDHHQPGLFQQCSYYNTKWHELSVMIVLFNETFDLIRFYLKDFHSSGNTNDA